MARTIGPVTATSASWKVIVRAWRTTRPDLYQIQLQAGQGPLGHFLGQFDAAQEGCQVVGQRVELQDGTLVLCVR